jgi:hypothetical protein
MHEVFSDCTPHQNGSGFSRRLSAVAEDFQLKKTFNRPNEAGASLLDTDR